MTSIIMTNSRPLVAPRKVREWARQAGHVVGERGRLREDLVAEYRKVVAQRSK